MPFNLNALLVRCGEPLDKQIDASRCQILAIQRLLSVPSLEKVLESDLCAFVLVKKLNVDNLAELLKDLNKKHWSNSVYKVEFNL